MLLVNFPLLLIVILEDEECDDYEEGYKAGYKAAKRKYSHMIEDRY